MTTRAEPTTLRAGDSIAWSRQLPDYPVADGWALKYRLLWPTGTAVDLTTTGDGDTYTCNQSASATAAWGYGQATLVAFVERGTDAALERRTLEAQPITILPDLSSASTHDGRSAAVRALAAARAALAAYVEGGRAHIESYEIGGRTFHFRSTKDIKDLIAHYEAEVARENAALALLQGGSPGRVCVRM